MSKFILVYHGGTKPETPEIGAAMQASWRSWVEDLGAAVITRGIHPIGTSKTVSANGIADGDGSSPISGFTVVETDNIEAASLMAQNCPFLDMDTATIEVAEIMEM